MEDVGARVVPPSTCLRPRADVAHKVRRYIVASGLVPDVCAKELRIFACENALGVLVAIVSDALDI